MNGTFLLSICENGFFASICENGAFLLSLCENGTFLLLSLFDKYGILGCLQYSSSAAVFLNVPKL